MSIPNGDVLMEQPQQHEEVLPPPPDMNTVPIQFNKSVKSSGGVQSHYETREFGPPQFESQLEQQIQVEEGEPIRLLCQVGPAGDNSLVVEWYKDGKPLITGSRFSTLSDRGYVVLDVLYSIEEDAGNYVCVARNNSGQAQTNTALVNVIPEAKIDNNSEFIEQQNQVLEQSEPSERQETQVPPQIVQSLTQGPINVNQGDPIRIELVVEPRNDVYLSVDWFKDSLPVSLGSRTTAVYDRGYCALDIAYSYPEDNGLYICVVHNKMGQVQTDPVQVTCNPDEKIITKSHLNEQSISQLQRFEYLGVDDSQDADFRNRQDEEQDQAPVFDKGLEDLVIDEGMPAKFLIKITSNPRARLIWTLDNEEIVSDSVNKFYNDGSINYLELSRCSDVGQHSICVVATNPLGQVSSQCNLIINSVHNYTQQLKHIAPENPYRRMASLKKVECSPELSTALKKPKPTTEKIVKIERSSELKSKHHKTSDVVETEKMYDQIAANLRTRSNNPISTGKKSVLNYEEMPPPPPPAE